MSHWVKIIFYNRSISFLDGLCGSRGLDAEEVCEETPEYCEAVFDTGGTTCNNHCESFGLVCVEGWDETDGDCASKLTDDSRRVGNGCDMVYGNQICRCSAPIGKLLVILFN